MTLTYLDHNASAPLRPAVLAAMQPFLQAQCGNASSAHALGSRARCAVEDARTAVAALVEARPAEIVFTSGGTESNNLAILGHARAVPRRRIVTTPIEHASVREPLAALRAEGYTVAELTVDAQGHINLDELERLLSEPTGLVTIGWANNEVGTIQPVEEIAARCRARGVTLHVDAVQAVGKIPVHVRGVDLLSISAHKFGGPQGVGALFARSDLALSPLLLGGGQERGRRAGTENVAGIVGMGEACRVAGRELGAFAEACVAMRDELWRGLQAAIASVRRNGPAATDCLPNTLNVSFAGVCGEALVAALDLDGVAVSSGSACAAGAGEPSHVLEALGYDADAARDGIRFSLGWTNTPAQIERVVAATAHAVHRIRSAKGSRD